MNRLHFNGENEMNPLRSIDRIIDLLKKSDESFCFEEGQDTSYTSQKWKVSSKTTDVPSQLAYADEDDLKELNDLIVSHRRIGQTLSDYTGTLSEIPNNEGIDNMMNSFCSVYSIPIAPQCSGSYYEHTTKNHDTPELGGQILGQNASSSKTADSQADIMSMLDTMKSIMVDSSNQINQKEVVSGLISYLQSYLQTTPSRASLMKTKDKDLDSSESKFSMVFSKENTVTKSCQGLSSLKTIPVSSLVSPIDFRKKEEMTDFDHNNKNTENLIDIRNMNRSINSDVMNMTSDCEYGRDFNGVAEDISIMTNHCIFEKDYSYSDLKDTQASFNVHKLPQDTKISHQIGINDISSIRQSLNVSRQSDIYAKDADVSFEYGLIANDNNNILAFDKDKQNNSLFVVPELSCEDTSAGRDYISTNRKSNRSMCSSGQVKEYVQNDPKIQKFDYNAYGKKQKQEKVCINAEPVHRAIDYGQPFISNRPDKHVAAIDLWGNSVMRSNNYIDKENTVRYF